MPSEIEDPLSIFKDWFSEAQMTEMEIPDAMMLATADKGGRPSARMVLMKEVDHRGFVFYTNLNSRKALELKENPIAALVFYWKALARQVRIEGNVEMVSDKEADTYHKSRPRLSQIGAWASKQSTVLKDKDELINSIKKYKEKYNNEKNVDRPEYWSGWNLTPKNIEFWLKGENRIHERLKYSKDDNGNWNKFLLHP